MGDIRFTVGDVVEVLPDPHYSLDGVAFALTNLAGGEVGEVTDLVDEDGDVLVRFRDTPGVHTESISAKHLRHAEPATLDR